jgi:hypothetical protein
MRIIFQIFIVAGFGLMVATLKLQAQSDSAFADRVVLNDGSSFVGQLQVVESDRVILQLRNGNLIYLQRSDIKHINQYSSHHLGYGFLYFQEKPVKYFFRLDAGMGFVMEQGELYPSFEIGGSYLYRIGDRHLAGIRGTVKSMSNFSYYFIPTTDLHLEYNYLIGAAKKLQPYISVRAGAGFVMSYATDFDSVAFSGFQPGGGVGVGLVKSLGEKSAYFTEIGITLQRYKYQLSEIWSAPTQRLETMSHLTMRIGYLF